MSPQLRPPLDRLTANRRLLALGGGVVGALAVVAVVAVLLASGGGSTPPVTGAARLVPADALPYVHVSSVSRRVGAQSALMLVDRFLSLPHVPDSLVQRLS